MHRRQHTGSPWLLGISIVLATGCSPETSVNQGPADGGRVASRVLSESERTLFGPGDQSLFELAGAIPNLATVTWDDAASAVVLGIRGGVTVDEGAAAVAVRDRIGPHIRNVRLESREGGFILDELFPRSLGIEDHWCGA